MRLNHHNMGLRHTLVLTSTSVSFLFAVCAFAKPGILSSDASEAVSAEAPNESQVPTESQALTESQAPTMSQAPTESQAPIALAAEAPKSIPDWQNPQVNFRNRLPMRSTFSTPDPVINLAGNWKFQGYETPSQRSADFFRPTIDDSA